MSENKATIYDLNNDCIQEIIKKLSINEILILESVDQTFQYCVKQFLKLQQVLGFGYYDYYCKRSSINSRISPDIKCQKLKDFLNKCPNIKCLQIEGMLINKSLIEWISNNCKQLVCIHFSEPKFDPNSTQIEFKEIVKLLSDKIEINFGNRIDTRKDSIIALLQNIPHFGHNIRSFSSMISKI